MSHIVRTVTDSLNKPWFVAADACRALGLDQHPKGGYGHHLGSLAADEVTPISVLGGHLAGTGMTNARMITEAGLYRLIMRSDKPQARPFQDWVTREVLPSIRKTGSYSLGEGETMPLPTSLAQALAEVRLVLPKKCEGGLIYRRAGMSPVPPRGPHAIHAHPMAGMRAGQ